MKKLSEIKYVFTEDEAFFELLCNGIPCVGWRKDLNTREQARKKAFNYAQYWAQVHKGNKRVSINILHPFERNYTSKMMNHEFNLNIN